MNDWSHQQAILQEQIYLVADAWQRPSVLYRPKVYRDGDMWCCLYGEDLQMGVVAFGKTPGEAAYNFDNYAWLGKPVPDELMK